MISKTTYPDGSIKIDTVTLPDNHSTYGFVGGNQSGGTTWWSVTRALAKSSNGVITVNFYVDY